MTPSISKMRARILFTGGASGGESGELSVEPGEVIGRAIEDGEGEDFRKLVRVRGFEHGAEGLEVGARGFDDEHPFDGVFDLAAPAVETADFGKKIDAGGEMGVKEFVRDARGFLFRAARAENNNFFCHWKQFNVTIVVLESSVSYILVT
jgi:hypothetical protein